MVFRSNLDFHFSYESHGCWFEMRTHHDMDRDGLILKQDEAMHLGIISNPHLPHKGTQKWKTLQIYSPKQWKGSQKNVKPRAANCEPDEINSPARPSAIFELMAKIILVTRSRSERKYSKILQMLKILIRKWSILNKFLGVQKFHKVFKGKWYAWYPIFKGSEVYVFHFLPFSQIWRANCEPCTK